MQLCSQIDSRKILLAAVLIAICFFAQAQNKRFSFFPRENKTLLYQWGLPHLEYENAAAEAAGKFGFTFYRVAGCSMPEDLQNHCDKHNAKLKRRVAKIHGSDWEIRFNKEADRLYQLFRKADTMSMSSDFFWEEYSKEFSRQEELSDTNENVIFDFPQKYFRETGKDSVLWIFLRGQNAWINNSTFVVFKQFELDMKTEKIILLTTAYQPPLTSK